MAMERLSRDEKNERVIKTWDKRVLSKGKRSGDGLTYLRCVSDDNGFQVCFWCGRQTRRLSILILHKGNSNYNVKTSVL
jgi:hypothetical protein